MEASLLRQLNSLCGLLGGPQELHRALQARELALKFFESVYEAHQSLSTNPRTRLQLTSKMVELSEALVRLDAALQPPLSRAAMMQLHAALLATQACAFLSIALQPDASAAQRMTQGLLQLLFGSGRHAVAKLLAAVEQPGGSQHAEALHLWVSGVLTAFFRLQVLMDRVSSTGMVPAIAPPHALMGWLSELSAALVKGWKTGDGMSDSDVVAYSNTVATVTMGHQDFTDAWSGDGNSALRSDVWTALMYCCLPAAAAPFEQKAARRRKPSGSGAGSAESEAGHSLMSARMVSKALLSVSIASSTPLLYESTPVRQLLHILAAAPPHAAAAGENDVVALALCQLSNSVIEGQEYNARQQGSSADLLGEVVWDLMRAIPHMASILRHATADRGAAAALARSHWLVTPVRAFPSLRAITSPEQLTAWAAAADAGLQLIPLLEQLATWQQDQQPQLQVIPSRLAAVDELARAILKRLWVFNFGCVKEWVAASRTAPQQQQPPSLAQQLFALHSRSCRLIHWLLAYPSCHVLQCVPWHPMELYEVLDVACTTMDAAVAALKAAPAGSVANRDLHSSVLAAGLAQLAAVEAVYAALAQRGEEQAALALGDDNSSYEGSSHQLSIEGSYILHWQLLRHLLASVPGACWRLADDRFMGQLLAAEKSQDQAGRALSLSKSPARVALADLAAMEPNVAITLARAGFLDVLLEVAFLDAIDEPFSEVPEVLPAFLKAISGLIEAGNTAVGELLERGSKTQQLLRQLQAAVKELEGEQQAVRETAEELSLQPSEAVQLHRRLLQPAAEVARLAQQAWQQAGLADKARLELAQAAATRSCAYLGCSNLGGEGGPAAGQGVGSKKCGQCRAVWYCSTACARANWRQGGHKHVCTALVV